MKLREARGARIGLHSAAASLAALMPLAAFAADLRAVNQAARAAATPASAVGTAVPALGFGALLQTVLGLALVLGLVFGCAWLARRFGLQGTPRNSLVKTIGGASLGGKERVAVVEVGDTWLVLGAAPGNVRLLHTLPAGSVANATNVTSAIDPTNAPAGDALHGSFGQRFRDALKGEVGKRFGRHDGPQR